MSEEIRAPITGVVFAIAVRAGQQVASGDPVIVLESMKMEIPVEAPRAGTVTMVRVAEGETVQEGQPLATLD